ncbi:MAG: proline--tRNA ligase [Thermoplasmata archaeon]|nr:MAG: proline--tRNA ligase [Thermoplasmata archaeon]KAA0010987.1 MAG: proline--tRNA ligase [Thermoplasmata archaeon]
MPETKVKKEEDFHEWYNEIVELADLCDKRYPIKGMNVWKPHGWRIMQNIDNLIREEMFSTNHKEVYFPLLIPESLFKKEEEHIEGFFQEVFWVTHAGDNELEERWLLRPTSETAMYPIFALWIRSHSDLPLKIFQIVNTFRYETKQTRAFIRVREIHFFEAHTAHVDFEDAERQIEEYKEIARRFFRKLCIPFIFNKRPDWDKFAGAYYTISMDALMPSGRTLQLGSIHQYRDNFARPYNIKYEDVNGEHKYCHQTTYGMSERILGAIIGIHGDNKGIVLPPVISPIKVVIIPIIFKGKEREVLEKCREINDRLKEAGIESHVDEREDTPGSKFYDWELKGVPLRIEIGPKELEKKTVVIARRDTGERVEVSEDNLVDEVRKLFDLISDNLYRRAEEFMKNHIATVDTLEEAKNSRAYIFELPWCGEKDCALRMEEELDLKTLGEPLHVDIGDKRCAACGGRAKTLVRLAKTY